MQEDSSSHYISPCTTPKCGTEGYLAPEILEYAPQYDVECDMWSMGVVLFMLLGGYRPFRGDSNAIERAIRYGDYKFHKRYWSTISEEAMMLISCMLTVNPLTRITATEALASEWMTEVAPSPGSLGDKLNKIKVGN
jgi:serine/threonine protein kinase